MFLDDTFSPWGGPKRYPSILAPDAMGFAKSSTPRYELHKPTELFAFIGHRSRPRRGGNTGRCFAPIWSALPPNLQIRLRQKPHFSKRINAESTVQPPHLKYFAFAVGQIIFRTSRHPAPEKRGVSRSSRTLGAGCDGRFGGALTNGAMADGEVVWS
jgi:hypothetical protein